MEKIVDLANQFVIGTACYALLFVVYGFIIYHLLKFILCVLAAAYERIKTDWTNCRAGHSKKEKRGNYHDND